MNSYVYKNEEQFLNCPKALQGNEIFARLKNRIMTSFILAEKYRLNGPTPEQIKQANSTGIDFPMRIKLHNCLKQLLREVILTPEDNI